MVYIPEQKNPGFKEVSKGLLTETTSKRLVVSVRALARMKTQSMLPSPEKL